MATETQTQPRQQPKYQEGEVPTRYPQFNLYKGKKTGGGAASAWKINLKGVFVELAEQTGQEDANGNSTFGWGRYNQDTKVMNNDHSVTAKLGLPDIGEILLVLRGIKKKAGYEGKGLYHANSTGSTTIAFDVWEKDGVLNGFAIRLSNKRGQEQPYSLSHAISLGEAEVLRVLLENSILQLTNWEV